MTGNMSVKFLPEGKFVGVSEERFRGQMMWRATVYRKGEKTLRKLCKDQVEAARWYNQQVLRFKLDKPLNVVNDEILR